MSCWGDLEEQHMTETDYISYWTNCPRRTGRLYCRADFRRYPIQESAKIIELAKTFKLD
jgi:uncharacterized protein YbaR (Trm112 family)